MCTLSAFLAAKWYYSDQVISKGEFQGIRIGAEKDEIYGSLIKNSNIGSVMGIDELQRYFKYDGFMKAFEGVGPEKITLIDGSATLDFDFRDGRLAHILKGVVYTVDIEVELADAWVEIMPKIGMYLKMHPEASVLPSNSGYGSDYNRFEVVLRSNNFDEEMGKTWLMKQDVWGFHYTNDFSYTRLEFEGNLLKRIVHRHRESELPW